MKIKKVLSLLIFVPTLMGCNVNVDFIYEEYDHSYPFINTHAQYEGEGYYKPYKPGKVDVLDKFTSTGIDSLSTFKKVSEQKHVYRALDNEEGYQQEEYNLLVVPLSFMDSPTYHDVNEQEVFKIKIQNAFFGNKKHNRYYSVSEYYQRSSYGHIKLSGEVAPFYFVDKLSTSPDLPNNISTVEKLAAETSIFLHSLDDTESSIDWDKYDNDEDGYVDGVYIIYDHPSVLASNSSDLLFWQVTDRIDKNVQGDVSKPFCDFSWSSIDCAGTSSVSESYYYIHETGHLFGLEDYYNSHTYQPTGFLDMMDYNLGDHTAFSKYLLNWTSPYVVTDNCSITLHPFLNSGEFILIPANLERFESYGTTPFEEYLLLEYFVPHELNDNRYFSNYRYQNDKGQTKIFTYPDIYGLKVYHVDARLAYFTSPRLNERLGFVYEDVDASKAKNLNYAYHNEINDNKGEGEVLYHLLERSGDNSFLHGNSASKYTFFQPGDHFGKDMFEDFKFHDGSELSFTFKFNRFSTKGIEIKFYKK